MDVQIFGIRKRPLTRKALSRMAAPGGLSRRYNRGRFQIDTGGILVVSVGPGCTTLPIRLNSDPEIIVCRLSWSSSHPAPTGQA